MAEFERYEGGGFVMGLVTGTVLGAGIGMLLAPKAGAELRGTLSEQAKHASQWSSEQYRRASEAASTLSHKGRDLVDRARGVVAQGAEEAREYADRARDLVAHGADQAKGYAEKAKESVDKTSTSYPGTGTMGSSDFRRS
jgi:gas vesicle protein